MNLNILIYGNGIIRLELYLISILVSNVSPTLEFSNDNVCMIEPVFLLSLHEIVSKFLFNS
jgi:hypothetical protein